ncbi:MAG: L-erythro-3,5-diaminohexanoate dehydrogenase [Bacillota bacterium]
MKPCPYGTHRVVSDKPTLPQAADVIDASMTLHPNELKINVHTLNIDSASFHQIKQAANNDKTKMKTMIETIVKTKGKMQNPITKSGGMLIGEVAEIGKDFHNQSLTIGTKIATLVSLSLTPLHIDEIIDINVSNEQVTIKGQAILFDSGIYATIPKDLNEKLVLASLDVAGAPAQVKKLAKPGDTVFIIGAAGKSGILCAYQAKKQVGPSGIVIGLVNEPTQIDQLNQLDLCDAIILADAQNAIDVYHKVSDVTNNTLADVTINVVNVPDTEMASILSTKENGTVYFFSMATSFTKAALGAEGVGKDVQMIIGNGYTKNHAETTLNIIRESTAIRNMFSQKYI